MRYLVECCDEITERICIEIELNTPPIESEFKSAFMSPTATGEAAKMHNYQEFLSKNVFQVILQAVNGEFVGTNFSARLTVAVF